MHVPNAYFNFDPKISLNVYNLISIFNFHLNKMTFVECALVFDIRVTYFL